MIKFALRHFYIKSTPTAYINAPVSHIWWPPSHPHNEVTSKQAPGPNILFPLLPGGKDAMDNVHCESCNIVIAYIIMPEAYSEPYHRSKMECFAKIVKTKNLITIFKKDAIC